MAICIALAGKLLSANGYVVLSLARRILWAQVRTDDQDHHRRREERPNRLL